MNTKHIQIAKSLGCTGEFPGDFNLAVERCADLLAMLERVVAMHKPVKSVFGPVGTPGEVIETYHPTIAEARALIATIKGE